MLVLQANGAMSSEMSMSAITMQKYSSNVAKEARRQAAIQQFMHIDKNDDGTLSREGAPLLNVSTS